jgi:1-acyl-sn-glycerol-3-phosphate acyltransferase
MLLQEWFARLILFVTCTLYRIQVVGRDNFPEKTGALLVCNHMSFVDAVLLVAATDRPIRCIMYQCIYERPVVKPFAAIMKAIPISSEQHPREMIRSLHAATQALREDEIVGIFAEGQITRTGQLLPFRRGLERILKDRRRYAPWRFPGSSPRGCCGARWKDRHSPRSRPRIAYGSDRHSDLLQRQHGRSQGRDAQPLQHRIEYQPG